MPLNKKKVRKLKAYALGLKIKGKMYVDVNEVSALISQAKMKLGRLKERGYEIVPVEITYEFTP